jgi:ACT domain-containing protein
MIDATITTQRAQVNAIKAQLALQQAAQSTLCAENSVMLIKLDELLFWLTQKENRLTAQ